MAPFPSITISRTPKSAHRLILLPAGDALPGNVPERNLWERLLKRKGMQAAELTKSPLATDLAEGTRVVLAMVNSAQPHFERLSLLRKATMLLLDEKPKTLDIVPLDIDDNTLADALYVAWVNGVPLPQQKKKPVQALKEIVLPRRPASADFCSTCARANLRARELITLPPNRLDPAHYRQRLRALAKEKDFTIEEYDFRRLKKMGAGAFCAVAQGSDENGGGAAIVRLAWRPKKKQVPAIALVGKGICYDTGGHNLKPGTAMTGMHTDMGGSAVALAILLAAAELKLPLQIDCWLAIAKNHISPHAYAAGDIVTALDGTTIEVVHTDAEGRMVLADALTFAVRGKPDLVIDFATLTGSMKTALGRRYAGVFASSDKLAAQAVAAGRESGERVCVFPQDADYDAALESTVADVKQCALEGGADHILATRFLGRFVAETPWLHMDLSPTHCSGGLGAIAGDITGFGVGWGITFLQALGEQRNMTGR
jgi:leucyl aminopeptidase